MHRGRCRWHDIYVAVLFETEPSKVGMRIADALITIDNAIRNEPHMNASERMAIRSARKTLAMMEADEVLDMIENSFVLGESERESGIELNQ